MVDFPLAVGGCFYVEGLEGIPEFYGGHFWFWFWPLKLLNRSTEI